MGLTVQTLPVNAWSSIVGEDQGGIKITLTLHRIGGHGLPGNNFSILLFDETWVIAQELVFLGKPFGGGKLQELIDKSIAIDQDKIDRYGRVIVDTIGYPDSD